MMNAILTLAQNNQEIPPGLAAGIIVFVLLVALVVLAIIIFIIYLLYKSAAGVPQAFQQMNPGLVWLMLIPLFNLVWVFFVVLKISGGYKAYFDSVNRQDLGDCGKMLGLVWAICSVVSIVPLIGMLAGLCGLVCMILYLVKVTGLKNQVAASPVAAV